MEVDPVVSLKPGSPPPSRRAPPRPSHPLAALPAVAALGLLPVLPPLIGLSLVIVAGLAGLVAGRGPGPALRSLWLPAVPLAAAALLILGWSAADPAVAGLGLWAAAALALLGAAQLRARDLLLALALVAPLTAVLIALAAQLGVAPSGGWPGLGALALLSVLCAADRFWSAVGGRAGPGSLLGLVAVFVVTFGLLALAGRTQAIALASLGIAALLLVRVSEIHRRFRWAKPVALAATAAGSALIVGLEVMPRDPGLDPAAARAAQALLAEQFRAWQAVLAAPLTGSADALPGAGGLARAGLAFGLPGLALLLLAVLLLLALAARRLDDAGSLASTGWLATMLLAALSLTDPSAGEAVVALTLAMLLGAAAAGALAPRQSRR